MEKDGLLLRKTIEVLIINPIYKFCYKFIKNLRYAIYVNKVYFFISPIFWSGGSASAHLQMLPSINLQIKRNMKEDKVNILQIWYCI